MLSTALALQEATQQAVMDEQSMGMAGAMLKLRNEMSDEDFAKALFLYSAHLSSLTTTLAVNVLLTESQMDEMMDTIKEFDLLGKEITNGNE